MSGITAHLQQVSSQAQDYVRSHKRETAIAAGVTSVALVAAYAWRRASRYVPASGPYPVSTLPAGAFHAIIVGAGPSGSVCAYFLAKAGIKAALLDKETFPRDKYCGDAVCTPAIEVHVECMCDLTSHVPFIHSHVTTYPGLGFLKPATSCSRWCCTWADCSLHFHCVTIASTH